MLLGQRDVTRRVVDNALLLVFREGSDDPGGRTYHKGAGRHLQAFCAHAAGSDDAPSPDVAPVEENGAHADQHAVLQRRPMYDGAVPDHAVFTDGGGNAGIGVDYGAVLDVGASADGDLLEITADDGRRPDAGVFGEGDSAEYYG